MRLQPGLYLIVLLVLFGTAPVFAATKATLVHLKRQDGADTAINVYTSLQNQNCPALALISHGAGGNENGLAYLATALQENGWTAVVIGHAGSGPDVLRTDIKKYGSVHDALMVMTTDAAAYKSRFMDIDAAQQWINRQCKAPFVALLGHSMGAATVMLEAGAKNNLELKTQNNIDAFVALSPQGSGSIFPPHAWQDIHKPVLMLTGTKDKALEGEWTTRTEPYDDMSLGCKWLGVIDGATHMNFAGNGFSRKTEKVTTHLAITFLDGLRDTGNCAVPPKDNDVQLKVK